MWSLAAHPCALLQVSSSLTPLFLSLHNEHAILKVSGKHGQLRGQTQRAGRLQKPPQSGLFQRRIWAQQREIDFSDPDVSIFDAPVC